MNHIAIIEETTLKVIRLLVGGDYEMLVLLTGGKRLPKEEIEYAIVEYGLTLTSPPEDVLDYIDVVDVDCESGREWSVRCPLWTIEEGQSDLSIELTIIETEAGAVLVELDNIIVF